LLQFNFSVNGFNKTPTSHTAELKLFPSIMGHYDMTWSHKNGSHYNLQLLCQIFFNIVNTLYGTLESSFFVSTVFSFAVSSLSSQINIPTQEVSEIARKLFHEYLFYQGTLFHF
jgi:hypothetical protein